MKLKHLIHCLTLLLFLIVSKSFCQSTQFQLHIDFGKSVIQVGNVLNTADGGYLTCGTLQDSNGKYPFLVKVANYGQIEWKMIYETSTFNSTGKYVIQTVDGGYIMVGEQTLNSLNKDVFVIRTDSVGNQIWNKTYGNIGIESCNNIVELPSGNYLLFGESEMIVKKGLIIRINTFGDLLETNFIDLIYNKAMIKGKLVGGNQIIVTGAGVTEVFTDTSGIYQGQSNIQLADTAITSDVMITSNGMHITIANMMRGSSTGHQLYVTSADSAAVPDWIYKFGTPVWSVWATSLFMSPNGGYIIAGQIDQWFGFPGFLFLSETDITGVMQWEKLYAPSNGPFRFGGACSTNDGGYIITGSGYMQNGEFDLFILKTDSVGNTGCFEGVNILLEEPASFSISIPLSGASGSLLNSGTLATITDTSFGSLNVLCYTGIDENTQFSKTTQSLYPNPFWDYIKFKDDTQHKGPFELVIYDLMGSMKINVFSESTEWSGTEFMLLPKGLYLVEVKTNGATRYRTKLVH